MIVVHHDLQTVPEYFDHVLLLNMRGGRGGAGRAGVHRREPAPTYGGRLALLDDAAPALARARRA